MLITTSPAKRLETEADYPDVETHQPEFIDKTARIHHKIKALSQKNLAQLLDVSEDLAERTHLYPIID